MAMDLKTSPSCPVCYSSGVLYRQFEQQNLYRCSGCESLFYYPAAEGSRPSAYESLESCPFHIERGANLLFYSEIIHYVNLVFSCSTPHRLRERPNILEVGCSYGFLLDIARLLHDWKMTGVDPDPCAAQGREELEAPVTQTRLEDLRTDNLYDAVISVESVEHVADPREHVLCMVRLLCDDGFLIMTTPDASRSNLGPHLWPGEHHVIFSRDGLERLLNEAGMRYCHFFDPTISQIMAVVASRKPVPSEEIDRFRTRALEVAIQSTTRYLLIKHETKHRSALLQRGLHFRLFELLVNQGRYAEAQQIEKEIDEMVQLSSSEAPFSVIHEYVDAMTATEDPMSYLNAGPACLAPYLFYKGILALNYTASPLEAEVFFESAARLFKKEVDQFDLTHFRVFWDAAESHKDLARLRADEIRLATHAKGISRRNTLAQSGFPRILRNLFERMARKPRDPG
jgi:SAM-dependent methyltransferase